MLKTRLPRMRPAYVSMSLCAALALAGCGKTPERAANRYLDNLRLFNYPACYEMLSHQDQLDRTLEQFLTDIPLAPDVSKDWFKPILRQMNYRVGAARMEGTDKAIVPVQVTMPDLALWERTVYATTPPDQMPDQVAQKLLESGQYPKVTYDDDIVLLKEGNEWRLFVDYAAKDKFKKMHKDAVELYHKHDYDKAIAAYQDLLTALGKDEATDNDGLKFFAERELKDVESAKANIPEAQTYIPKLVLSDVDMKMAASRVPGIFGKIKNTGDKPIDEVQMTVTYWEGRGRRKKKVYEEDHTPIATPLEFTNFSRPVLPLVPGETRDFGFRLTAPPEIQQRATPDLNVTKIVFTQSSAPLPKPPAPSPTPSPVASPGAPAGGPPPTKK
jgi:hypothetical protein